MKKPTILARLAAIALLIAFSSLGSAQAKTNSGVNKPTSSSRTSQGDAVETHNQRQKTAHASRKEAAHRLRAEFTKQREADLNQEVKAHGFKRGKK